MADEADWFAKWLVEARESQRTPDTNEPWTQDHFLKRLKADTGWSLHRSNLSAYENGRQQPKAKTLQKFIAFWKPYGIEPPDPNAKRAEPEPQPDPVVEAIDRQTKALENLTAAIWAVLGRSTPGQDSENPYLTDLLAAAASGTAEAARRAGNSAPPVPGAPVRQPEPPLPGSGQ